MHIHWAESCSFCFSTLLLDCFQLGLQRSLGHSVGHQALEGCICLNVVNAADCIHSPQAAPDHVLIAVNLQTAPSVSLPSLSLLKRHQASTDVIELMGDWAERTVMCHRGYLVDADGRKKTSYLPLITFECP